MGVDQPEDVALAPDERGDRAGDDQGDAHRQGKLLGGVRQDRGVEALEPDLPELVEELEEGLEHRRARPPSDGG
jgi:hypothetical protein